MGHVLTGDYRRNKSSVDEVLAVGIPGSTIIVEEAWYDGGVFLPMQRGGLTPMEDRLV